jgi:hypothetical protein
MKEKINFGLTLTLFLFPVNTVNMHFSRSNSEKVCDLLTELEAFFFGFFQPKKL